MKTRRSPHLLTATALAASLMLVACGGGTGEAPPAAPGAPADTTGPVVTITDSVTDVQATGPVTFNFTFNEDVGTSFVIDDVTVTGGTKGAFTRINGTSATLVVTPTANSAGTIQVSLAAGAVLDARGNPSAVASSQQAFDTVVRTQMSLPVSFDGTGIGYGLVGFGGAEDATIVADPTLATNKVAKVVRAAGAETFAGTTITDTRGGVQTGFSPKIPFNTTDTRMSVRVWSPDAGIPVRLKVEDSADGNKSVETEATVTTAAAWQTLTFDFKTQATGTAALNLANNYNKATIFFDFGRAKASAVAKTYYFDDLTFVPGAPTPPPGATGTLLASFDEATPLALVGFDGGEGSAIDAAPPAGGGTGKALKILRSGGQVWAGAKVTVAPPAFSATERTITARVFSPAAGRRFVLKMEGPGVASAEIDATPAVVAGWQTLSWVVTGLDITKSYPDVVFLPNLGTLAPVAGETYYVDDIRFSGAPAAGSAGSLMVSFDEAPAKVFAGFDGGEGSSIDAAPPAGGATGKALRILRSGGQVWAGAKVTTAAPIFTATDKTITAKVYSPKAGVPIVLKMEGTGIASAEIQAKQPVVVGWQTLSWDITGIDITKSYPDVVMLPNLGTLGPVAGESFWFDDIRFSGALAAVSGPAGADMGSGGAVTMAVSTGDAKGIFAAGEAIFAGDYIGSREPNPPNNLAGWPNARTDGVVANGSIGYYNDTLLSTSPQKLDEGGWVVGTSLDAGGTPNFFRYVVLRAPSSTFASSYLGLYANAPNNGTVNVSGFASLKMRAWGPAEQYQQGNLNPVLEVILSGPKVAGCTTTGSGGTEITKNLTANLKIGAGSSYKVGLASGWVVKGVCGADTNATAVAAVLSKLSRVAVTVPATSFNWINANPGATPSWSSGLNLGPIGFTNIP